MPITPFHFGPGAALHAVAPQHVSFLAFCMANVLIDVESLYNLVNDRDQVHAFFHTYVGATLVAIGMVLLFLAVRRLAPLMPNLFRWRDLSVAQVLLGALAGAYSHVVLDSVMHHDITPLAPFSSSNALRGMVSIEMLHGFCAVSAVFALGVLCIRWLLREGEDEH